MKLPDPAKLVLEEHGFLSRHDQREFHCKDPQMFGGRFYKKRFEETIAAVRLLEKNLAKAPSEISILDVGCAQGNLSIKLAELGFKITALDLRFIFLTYSQMKWEKGQLSWVNASLENLPFLPGSFDIVIAAEVIEHVAHPDRLLTGLTKVCKRSGAILITTPNGNRMGTGIPTFSEITNHGTLEPKQFMPDAEGHLFLMTSKELKIEGKKAGLEIIRHQYLGTPWITGGMKMHFLLYLPLFLRRICETFFVKTPILAPLFSEGQLAVFKCR